MIAHARTPSCAPLPFEIRESFRSVCSLSLLLTTRARVQRHRQDIDVYSKPVYPKATYSQTLTLLCYWLLKYSAAIALRNDC